MTETMPDNRALYTISVSHPDYVSVDYLIGPVDADVSVLEATYRTGRKRPTGEGFLTWLIKKQGFIGAAPHTTYAFGEGIWSRYDPRHPEQDVQPGEQVPYVIDRENGRQQVLFSQLRTATEVVQGALRVAEGLDDTPGLYHRLEAVLEALRGILGDVERA
jgi:hypothetical protein